MKRYFVYYFHADKWNVLSGSLGPRMYADREKAITKGKELEAIHGDVMVVEEDVTVRPEGENMYKYTVFSKV